MARISALLLVASLALPAAAQSRPASAARTLLVLPFSNDSAAPGLEWISEAFPELLGERMASPTLYVVSQEDRAYAFDRAGIPETARLSRATLYRVAEQMDVDYVVLGSFNFDGQTFSADAQLLDMKRLHLSAELKESGPLLKIIEVQTALAWDLLRLIDPADLEARQQFLASAPAVRLDAFENYIRGVVATNRTERVQHLKEAVRLNPDYTEAILRLGRTYYDARDYDDAAAWLARVPRGDAQAREASFYLGLAAYYLGDFARAEDAFSFLASRLPLTEVYNNLGVVAARRGKRAGLDYFQKAVKADPNDPDYRFNLAVALYKQGDNAGAARQLREVLALRPADGEAKSLLETIGSNAASHIQDTRAQVNGKPPLERIKRNYDESSFQMLALEIQNATELRLSKTDPRTHAAYHVERGRDLLNQGFSGEAEKEFREAVSLDPGNAQAHVGLARVLEGNNDAAGARVEAASALRLGPSAEALLVLARLELKDNKPEAAAADVDQALSLEPSNATALALKNTIAGRLAERSAKP